MHFFLFQPEKFVSLLLRELANQTSLIVNYYGGQKVTWGVA